MKMVDISEAMDISKAPPSDAPRLVQRVFRMKIEFNKLFDKLAEKTMTETRKGQVEAHMREIYADLVSLELEAKAQKLRKSVAGGVKIEMPASKFVMRSEPGN